jgi:hypothetical protein
VINHIDKPTKLWPNIHHRKENRSGIPSSLISMKQRESTTSIETKIITIESKETTQHNCVHANPGRTGF